MRYIDREREEEREKERGGWGRKTDGQIFQLSVRKKYELERIFHELNMVSSFK